MIKHSSVSKSESAIDCLLVNSLFRLKSPGASLWNLGTYGCHCPAPVSLHLLRPCMLVAMTTVGGRCSHQTLRKQRYSKVLLSNVAWVWLWLRSFPFTTVSSNTSVSPSLTWVIVSWETHSGLGNLVGYFWTKPSFQPRTLYLSLSPLEFLMHSERT